MAAGLAPGADPDPDVRIETLCNTLAMLCEQGEWAALEPAVAEFSTFITGLDPEDAATVARMERAQKAISEILPTARAAHAAVESEIRELSRGRKAVSAYR